MELPSLRRSELEPATGQVGCYGKLPFYPEFLKYGLDSPGARWLVSWIDGARPLLGHVRDDAIPERELHVVLPSIDPNAAIVAWIAMSCDEKERSFPICVFARIRRACFGNRWHLWPVLFESIWSALAGCAFAETVTGRPSLAAALEQFRLELPDAESLERELQEIAEESCPNPWRRLTGSAPEAAVAMAHSFAHFVEAQRRAEPGGGSALSVPRAALMAEPDPEPAVQASVWLKLFESWSGGAMPAAVVEVVGDRDPALPELCIFGRQPIAADLAGLLLPGSVTAGIDRVAEPRSPMPAAEQVGEVAATLLAPTNNRLAQLWTPRS